jgi:predicted nucleic acid-binding protein
MLKIFLDADVLMASAASSSPNSAGQVLLSLSEITLIEAITSELIVEECERNIPTVFERSNDVLRTFRKVVERALDVVDRPTRETVRAYQPYAAWSDAPHLACASEHACRYLVTYNLSDYDPSDLDIKVAEPGTVVRRVRTKLAAL